ncbi:MAG TPA: hypothetical protein VN682_08505 [Terriglobales bacterium]|nr:hypothetical protein [Terriglobales bacterium]
MHPLVRDVLLSGITSLVTSGSALLVVALVGRLGDPKAVAEYLLVRRMASWILAGVLLGINVALPRYVAHAVNRPGLQKRYFCVALALGTAATCVLALVIDMDSRGFASLFFGDSQFKALIVPLSLLVLANGFHSTVFGFYRGRLEMERANALQFLNFALFPVVTVLVLWLQGSVAAMFLALGTVTLFCTALMAIPIFKLTSQAEEPWRGLPGELLRYGTARIPGDLALSGMFTIAPLIASHYVSLAKLAPLLLGLGILTVLGTSANPLNQVLLSKVTMMLAEGRMAQARIYVQHLLAGAVEVSIFVCLQSVIFADVAIRIWVGPKYLDEMLLIRILLASLPFYLLYTALRCVIDAASVTAYNTRNILVGFALFISVVLLEVRMVSAAWLLDSIAAAFLLALLVLAWLTVATLKQLYDVQFSWRNSIPSLAFCAVLGLAGFLLHWPKHTSALEFITLEILFTALFLGFANWRRSPWMAFLRDAFLQRPAVVQCTNDLVALKTA